MEVQIESFLERTKNVIQIKASFIFTLLEAENKNLVFIFNYFNCSVVYYS